MRKRFAYLQRILSLFVSVVMVMGLFSGCGQKPLSGVPYTMTVESDASGARQWSADYDKDGIVTHTVTEHADTGETEVVFTGVKKGTAKVTLYRAEPGQILRAADDVFVFTLCVDRKGNVTKTGSDHGAYTVDCGSGISGAEWKVVCSDESVVRWAGREKPFKSDEDGMQSFTMEYTFTGRHPGAAHVQVQTYLPWADEVAPMRDFWLFVDGEYRVSLLEATDFESVRLSVQGSSAGQDVYEAQKTEDGVKLFHYTGYYDWSDAINDYAETREDETVLDGGEAAYRYIAGLLTACDVRKWDGFRKSNPHVLDGEMFSFSAKLADGTTITASGSNSFPVHYGELVNALHDYVYYNNNINEKGE